MKNKKTLTKVFNAINIFLVCAMTVFVAAMMIIFSQSYYEAWIGALFGLYFTIPITLINVIKFVVEGIKTFNNDNVVLENKALTKGKKALKIAFAVINVLIVCTMVITSEIVVFKTSEFDNVIITVAMLSAFYLIPFIVINAVKFIICGTTPVFAQNYKKPFKMVFIIINALLICTMIIHSILSACTDIITYGYSFDYEGLIIYLAFYSYLLAVFNGIKFIIDDIKSLLHKGDKTDKN